MATIEDADVEAARAAYAAFARGDIDAAVADLAVDVEWIEPDEFPDGDRHQGREAVRGLQRSRAVWRELHSTATVFRRGERVIAHHHVAGTLQNGVTQVVTVADVYTSTAAASYTCRRTPTRSRPPDGDGAQSRGVRVGSSSYARSCRRRRTHLAGRASCEPLGSRPPQPGTGKRNGRPHRTGTDVSSAWPGYVVRHSIRSAWPRRGSFKASWRRRLVSAMKLSQW